MFEHAHQRTRGEVQSSLVFRNKRKAYPIQRRAKNQFFVFDNQMYAVIFQN